VVRAAVVRRRRAVVVLGDLAAVEREPVLRVDALRVVERVRAPVAGLRVVVDLRAVVLRAVVLRAAGLRAVLEVLDVLVVVLLVVSAIFGTQPLSFRVSGKSLFDRVR
jgi:hypothetical protein